MFGCLQMQRRSKDAAEGRQEVPGTDNTCPTARCRASSDSERCRQQALRCLRGRKRVEKRAENLLAKLESIREILDRITQSQTDKMVRDEAATGPPRAAVKVF